MKEDYEDEEYLKKLSEELTQISNRAFSLFTKEEQKIILNYFNEFTITGNISLFIESFQKGIQIFNENR